MRYAPVRQITQSEKVDQRKSSRWTTASAIGLTCLLSTATLAIGAPRQASTQSQRPTLTAAEQEALGAEVERLRQEVKALKRVAACSEEHSSTL